MPFYGINLLGYTTGCRNGFTQSNLQVVCSRPFIEGLFLTLLITEFSSVWYEEVERKDVECWYDGSLIVTGYP